MSLAAERYFEMDVNKNLVFLSMTFQRNANLLFPLYVNSPCIFTNNPSACHVSDNCGVNEMMYCDIIPAVRNNN
jgi:hypothetical protein